MANEYKPIVGYTGTRLLLLGEAYAEATADLKANQNWDDDTVAKAKADKDNARAKLIAAIVALEEENQRLTAELGDLPEAQAEILAENKLLRALFPKEAKAALEATTKQDFEFPEGGTDPAWQALAAWVICNLQTKLDAAEKRGEAISNAFQAGHNAGVAHHKQATLHMRENAGRYRWLRQQHWSTSTLAVVMDPKKNVEIGTTCPSMEQLDAEIDRLRGVT